MRGMGATHRARRAAGDQHAACSVSYMAKVYGGGPAPGDRIFHPIERLIYRLCGVDEKSEQRWPTYAISLLAFSFVSVLILYAQLRLQGSPSAEPGPSEGRRRRSCRSTRR